MRDLISILFEINKAVDDYNTLQLKQITEQSEILRRLTTNLYWLEEHRIQAHKKWHSIYFQSTGKTNAAKEREADNKCPEIYQIRRITTAAYKVVDSIRSTISAYKREG